MLFLHIQEVMMKRYISSNKEIIDIEVIINFETNTDNLAASTYVHHPNSIAAKNKLTDAELNVIDNIVESIISHVLSCNFKLGNHYQSKKSYAYYVEFIVPDTLNEIKMIRMKFRVGEHKGTAGTKATRRIIIKDIKVGKKEFQSPVKMIYEIDDMFTELSKGNIDAVFEFLN